jgi:hypothetical protein
MGVVTVSYNGSGTFQINTSGQPVVAGTVISSTAFNALTADLATGLSTAITKDGQTTTTARIIFAQGTRDNTLTASSAVATDASKNLVSVTNTGTGNNVLATNPTLVTPALGTPASGVMTNVTGINYDGFKNRIINGAMVIDQRNAGASVAASGQYTLDRWVTATTVASKFNVQQNAGSVTPPTGFATYLGITSSSAYSVPAGEIYAIGQYIEGINFYDLAWGTANAKTVTLSFQVYSSLTGTFGGALQNSAQNRSYPFSYTVSSANTWTTVSVTIAGDTSGTWIGATNGVGVRVFFSVGTGSTYSGTVNAWAGSQYYQPTGAVSVVGTNTATLYITGVQLEKGSTATSFDYRPYGTELALCQRYYESITGYPIYVVNNQLSHVAYKVTKRATPSTVTLSSGTINGSTVDGFNSSVATGTPSNFAATANSEL